MKKSTPSTKPYSTARNSSNTQKVHVIDSRTHETQTVHTYVNTKLREEQEAYLRKMKEHPVIEKMRDKIESGGYEPQTKGVTRSQIGVMNERVGEGVTHMAYSIITKSAGESAKGVRMVTQTIGLMCVPLSVVGRLADRSTHNRYMNSIMNRNEGEFYKRKANFIAEKKAYRGGEITKISNDVKLSKLEKALMSNNYRKAAKAELMEINKILAKNGMRKIPFNVSAATMVKMAKKNLRKMTNKPVPKEVKEAFERALKLGRAGGIPKSGFTVLRRSRLLRQLKQSMNRAMSSSDAGRGFYEFVNVLNITAHIVKKYIRFVQKRNSLIGKVVQKGLIAIMQRNTRLIQERTLRLNNMKILGASDKEIQKLEKKLRRSQGFDKVMKPHHISNTRIGRFGSRVSDGYRNGRAAIRRGVRNAWNNSFAGKKFGAFKGKVFNFTSKIKNNKVFNSISKVTGAVFGGLRRGLSVISQFGRAIRAIGQTVMKIVGGIAVIYLLLLIIISVVQILISALDFKNASNKDILTKHIEDMYLDDLRYILQEYQGKGYKVTFEDIRDQSAYNEKEKDKDTPTTEGTTETTESTETILDEDSTVWFQSTNVAEICSMIYYRFDYDLEPYDTEVLKDIAEGMYYGSHEITGTTYGTNSGDIVYKTWYFNSLFSRNHDVKGEEFEYFLGEERKRKYHSPDTVKSGSVTGNFTGVEKEVFETLVNTCGYTPIAAVCLMGNIYGESGFNYEIHGCNDAYGLYQFDPGASGSSSSPSAGSTLDSYYKFLSSSGKKDSPAAQTEFVQAMLPSAFVGYTGMSSVYSYGYGNTTDITMYHVWTLQKFTFDEFKEWGKDSNLADELVADFKARGDANMTASEVVNYLDSLSDEEKAVAYGTLLFTRVYERPSSRDWISQRVKKAIEYYGSASIGGGYTGEARDTMEKGLTPEDVSKNPCYTSHNGGISPFSGDIGLDVLNGDRGGNCTAYAWGRRAEMEGGYTDIGTYGNACSWYLRELEYGRYRVSKSHPQVGAIVCWSYVDSGTVTATSGSAGHVAIIERIDPDGTIITSNSGYGSHSGKPTLFYIDVFANEEALVTNNYDNFSVFQGYIYIDRIDGKDNKEDDNEE